MIYVAMVPAFAWVLLLASAWTTLAYRASKLFALRNRMMSALLVVMGLQAIVASSVAITTSIDPIDYYPCRVGVFGAAVTLVIAAIEAIALGYLSRAWPRDAAGKRHRFVAWLGTWLVFTVIVLLAHIRSAALCTV